MRDIIRLAHERLSSLIGVVISIPALLAVGGYALSSNIEMHHGQRTLLPLQPSGSSLPAVSSFERTDQLWALFLKKIKIAIDRYDSTTIAPSRLESSEASRGQSRWPETKATSLVVNTTTPTAPGPADLHLLEGGMAINDYAKSDAGTYKDSQQLTLTENSSHRTWKTFGASSFLHDQPATNETLSDATGYLGEVTDRYDASGLKLATKNREKVDATENSPARQDYFLHDQTPLPKKNRDEPDSNSSRTGRKGISRNEAENHPNQTSPSSSRDKKAAYYRRHDFAHTKSVSHIMVPGSVMVGQRGFVLNHLSHKHLAEPEVKNEREERSSEFVDEGGIRGHETLALLPPSNDGPDILNLFTNFSKSTTGLLENSRIISVPVGDHQLYSDTVDVSLSFRGFSYHDFFPGTSASAEVSSAKIPDLWSGTKEAAMVVNESAGSNTSTLSGTVGTNNAFGVTLFGGLNSSKISKRFTQSTLELTGVASSTKYTRPDEIMAVNLSTSPDAVLYSSKATLTVKSVQRAGLAEVTIAGDRLDSGNQQPSMLESEQRLLVKAPDTPRLNTTETFKGMQPMHSGGDGVSDSGAYLAVPTVHFENDTIPKKILQSGHSKAPRRQFLGMMEPISADAYSKREVSTPKSGIRHTSELSETLVDTSLENVSSDTRGKGLAANEQVTAKRDQSPEGGLSSGTQQAPFISYHSLFHSQFTRSNLSPDRSVAKQAGSSSEYLVTYNFGGDEPVHSDTLQDAMNVLFSGSNDTREHANMSLLGASNTENSETVGKVTSQTTNSFNLTLELDRIAVEFAEFFKRKEREEEGRRTDDKVRPIFRSVKGLGVRDHSVKMIDSANYRPSSSSPSDKEEAGVARTTKDNTSGSTRLRNNASSPKGYGSSNTTEFLN